MIETPCVVDGTSFLSGLVLVYFLGVITMPLIKKALHTKKGIADYREHINKIKIKEYIKEEYK